MCRSTRAGATLDAPGIADRPNGERDDVREARAVSAAPAMTGGSAAARRPRRSTLALLGERVIESLIKISGVSAVIFVVVMFFSFLFTPTSPAPALYIFAALVGIGSGGVVIMIYALFPDIPDVDELRSNERREGTYSALTTFTRKLSSALAIFAVAQVLQFAGYIPPIQQAGRLIESAQTPTFISAIRLFFVLLPVVFISFGIFFATRFPLTVDIYRRLENVLAGMRGGADVDPQERQALIKRLIG